MRYGTEMELKIDRVFLYAEMSAENEFSGMLKL